VRDDEGKSDDRREKNIEGTYEERREKNYEGTYEERRQKNIEGTYEQHNLRDYFVVMTLRILTQSADKLRSRVFMNNPTSFLPHCLLSRH
jgi:hypothetical protein